MTLSQLLDEIERRPTMYIGERSTACLIAFLDGWLLGAGSAEDRAFILGFQKWVQDKYRIVSTQSWARIISFYSADEVAALETAFALFREYRSMKHGESSIRSGG